MLAGGLHLGNVKATPGAKKGVNMTERPFTRKLLFVTCAQAISTETRSSMFMVYTSTRCVERKCLFPSPTESHVSTVFAAA